MDGEQEAALSFLPYPGHKLDKVAVQHDAGLSIKDRGARVVDKVAVKGEEGKGTSQPPAELTVHDSPKVATLS